MREEWIPHSFPASFYSYFALIVPLFVARFSRIIKKFYVVPTFGARFVAVYKKQIALYH